MKKPLVNVIIITTNQFDFIGNCIRSLLADTFADIRIYLVDNNSDITKYRKFRNEFRYIKHITFIRNKYNLGFAGACNVALRKIKEGYIVFLNDDVVVTKNWLKPIITYMDLHPNVGACQPKIKNLVRRDYFDYAGGAGGLMDVYGYPYCRGRVFYTIEKDTDQYNDMIDLVWCSGACFVTKQSVLSDTGFMDEIFFIYQEEADLSWRMHFHNYRLVYVPDSAVYHFGSATMKNGTFRKTYLHHRNTIILLLKNYTVTELLRYMPVRIFLDCISFWYYSLGQGKFANAFAVIWAYINLLVMFPQIMERRKLAAFKNPDFNKKRYPLYKGSAILNYFVFNKKTHAQFGV